MVKHPCWPLILLCTLLGIGCNNSAPTTTQESRQGDFGQKATDQKVTDPFAAPADLKFTADELGKEEHDNAQATRTKYKGKVIELSGTVHHMNRSSALEPLMHLDVKDSYYLTVHSADPKPWNRVSPGQSVKLKVMYQKTAYSVELVAGSILEVSGEPCPTIDADEFGKARTENPKAFDTKYKDQAVILTGEIVVAAEGYPGKMPELSLKAGKNLTIECSPDSESVRGLRPGMRVKVTGVYDAPRDGHSFGRVSDCVVMDILK